MQSGIKRQQGMTFLGLVIVVAAIVFLAMVGMKMVPAYIEFMGVKKAITRIASEPNFNDMGKKEIMQAFDKAASATYVEVVKGSDLVIESGDAGKVITVDYQVVKPIAANVSVQMDFHASTAK